MKKILKITFWTGVAGFLIYHFFFYADFKNYCFVKIKPSITEFSNLNIKRAIRVLKNGSPSDYRTFCAHVDTIDPNPSCGGFGGGCFYSREDRARTIDISTSNRDLVWTSAIIMHETCHAIQYQEKRPLSEDECYLVDDKTIKTLMQYAQ